MARKFVNVSGKIRTKAFGGIGKITSAIRSIFRGRPKAPPQQPQSRVVGHRGIAAGSLRERQRLQAEGKYPYTAEEIARWHNLSGDEVEDFVENSTPLFVNSSNVILAQYFPEVQKMLVEFGKNGRHASYLYSSVSKAEALAFAQASSKGAFIWDTFRIRGTKNGHRKPYVRVSGKIIATPKPKPTGLTPQQIQDLQVPPGEAL